MISYIELHIHSSYTQGNSTLTISEAVQRASEYGMNTLGIMDSGTMNGVEEFVETCRQFQITPIIGCGFYFTLDNHQQVSPEKYHLPILSETPEGLQNLKKLNEISQTDGFQNRPQIDLELIQQYKSGLILLTGGRGGPIDKLLKNANDENGQQLLLTLKSIVGENNLFVELQDNGRTTDSEVNQTLSNLAHTCDLQCVVTGGPFYLDQSDAEQCNKLRLENGNGELVGTEFNFRSPEEQIKRFSQFPEAINNSVLIAERCKGGYELIAGDTK